MAYLILNDYKKLIQTDQLSQIIGADYSLVNQIQIASQTEVESYLVQKYDTDKEFTDTSLYVHGTTYQAKDRIYLDATAYSSTSTYAVNALVLYNNNVYRCTTQVTVAEAWNAAKWTLLGAQYAMFYVTLPADEYDYYTSYEAGDVVWYKDKQYTALSGSTGYIPTEYPQTWGSGVAYSTAVVPTDTTKWTSGDNRNAQMVNTIIDVALYHIHSRIAPRNIPDLRAKRYDDAIMWLKNCAKGDSITADIPKVQPTQGMRIRYGSRLQKQNNNW